MNGMGSFVGVAGSSVFRGSCRWGGVFSGVAGKRFRPAGIVRVGDVACLVLGGVSFVAEIWSSLTNSTVDTRTMVLGALSLSFLEVIMIWTR